MAKQFFMLQLEQHNRQHVEGPVIEIPVIE